MFSIFEKACFRNDALNGPHRTKINLMVCLCHHMQFFYFYFFFPWDHLARLHKNMPI